MTPGTNPEHPAVLFVGGPSDGKRLHVPVWDNAIAVPLICYQEGSTITTTTYRRIRFRDSGPYYEQCSAFFHESIRDEKVMDAMIDGYRSPLTETTPRFYE